MPDRRDYLRARGLDDVTPSVPAPQPFGVNLQTGEIVATEPTQPLGSIGLPEDYSARLVAVEQGGQLLRDEGIETALGAIRRIHAFLTDTEPKPPSRETLHTDE